MGKGSGSTRVSTAQSPKGISSGGYNANIATPEDFLDRQHLANDFYDEVLTKAKLPEIGKDAILKLDNSTEVRIINDGDKNNPSSDANRIVLQMVQNGEVLGKDSLHYGESPVPWGSSPTAQEQLEKLIRRNNSYNGIFKAYVYK